MLIFHISHGHEFLYCSFYIVFILYIVLTLHALIPGVIIADRNRYEQYFMCIIYRILITCIWNRCKNYKMIVCLIVLDTYAKILVCNSIKMLYPFGKLTHLTRDHVFHMWLSKKYVITRGKKPEGAFLQHHLNYMWWHVIEIKIDLVRKSNKNTKIQTQALWEKSTCENVWGVTWDVSNESLYMWSLCDFFCKVKVREAMSCSSVKGPKVLIHVNTVSFCNNGT